MTELSRRERRVLRELAGRAYSRELAQALGELEREFGRWRAGRIDEHQLSDRIHAFHDGENRELWTRYTRQQSDRDSVARAVALGLLDRSEVDPDLLAKMEEAVRWFERAAAD